MEEEILPIDYRKRIALETDSLAKDKSVHPQNKRLIKSYASDCYAEGLSHARVLKYMNLMKQIARRLNKPFRTVNVDDLKALLRDVELSDYSAWTKRDFRIGIRRFWRWLDGGDRDPPLVSWIKTTLGETKKKHPADMLAEDEIERLIDTADHPRDRALVAVFWETGCRAGELLTLRIRSFKPGPDVSFLDVTGKTGPRRIPIMACVPHLSKWLAFHPRKDDPNSPMWTIVKNNQVSNLRYGAFAARIRSLTKKAGIKKRVHPHLFRHSRATFLASRLTEAQMKHFFGWTQGSEMASTYVHLSARDIQDSILQMYGKSSVKEETRPKVTITRCARCGSENSSDSRFCSCCGNPASITETVSLSQKLQIYDDLLTALMSDKRVAKVLEQHLDQDKNLSDRLKQLVDGMTSG